MVDQAPAVKEPGIFENAYNYWKGELKTLFTASATNTPVPGTDPAVSASRTLAASNAVPVVAVRDNSGLLGGATRALINQQSNLDAAIDEASGGAPVVRAAPKP